MPPVGIGLVVNRVFAEVNDTFCKMTRFLRSELVGKSSEMIYPSKEEYDYVGTEKYRQISLTGTGSVETRFRKKDGIIINVMMSSTPLDIHDLSKGVTFTAMDITELQVKESELRKLSKAVEQNPASIIITDTDGFIEYVNPKFCEVTGYTADELSGKKPGILSSHEKSGGDYRILWDTIKSGKEWRGEFHNRKKNGDLYWESALISPIKNEIDEITHFLGIKEEITLRKILEASTKESEQRYRELFLNNPIPTYIFDESTLEFIEVNEAAILNYGYSREEFASMTLKDLRIPEEIPSLLESLEKIGSYVFHSTSMRHKKKDGTIFYVEITSHALPVKKGRKTRLVMAVDISDRVRAAEQMKIAREKAEASDKLKTTFLNNISHEVRTPLNGILGFAEIMSQSILSEDEKLESLSMLHESSNRLLGTITNYMDISLLTSGSLVVSNKDFRPGLILKILKDKYMPFCLSRKLKLNLETPADPENYSINSDSEIFYKIVTQLLDNAIKFTRKGEITFGFEEQGNRLEFFVRDTGIGVSDSAIKNIFDRFVKFDSIPTEQSEGSGLGLSIAKGMVEIIGGNIWVKSEVNAGSTFFFSVPFSNTRKQSGSAGAEQNQIKEASGLLILIAEDDEINYFYLNVLLKRETKAKILYAKNGKEAVDLFRTNPGISLVLMDLKMPGIDGLEATRQIKSMNSDVPVIAITAYAMAGDEQKVLSAGCDGYLSKPISKEKLLRKIAEFIKI